jgi:hypothetical protein
LALTVAVVDSGSRPSIARTVVASSRMSLTSARAPAERMLDDSTTVGRPSRSPKSPVAKLASPARTPASETSNRIFSPGWTAARGTDGGTVSVVAPGPGSTGSRASPAPPHANAVATAMVTRPRADRMSIR